MLIRTGFDIAFETETEVPMLALLNVRPERQKDLRTPEVVKTEPDVPYRQYVDSFGNVNTNIDESDLLAAMDGGRRLDEENLPAVVIVGRVVHVK